MISEFLLSEIFSINYRYLQMMEKSENHLPTWSTWLWIWPHSGASRRKVHFEKSKRNGSEFKSSEQVHLVFVGSDLPCVSWVIFTHSLHPWYFPEMFQRASTWKCKCDTFVPELRFSSQFYCKSISRCPSEIMSKCNCYCDGKFYVSGLTDSPIHINHLYHPDTLNYLPLN